MNEALNTAVNEAIASLRACFSDSAVTVEPDGSGGARVAVESVPLCPTYQQPTTWIAGHLVAQLPYADIYPLFIRGDLARCDNRALGAGLSAGHVFMGRSAVQASRRSNRRDPKIESAAHKFLKVLEWLRTHTGA